MNSLDYDFETLLIYETVANERLGDPLLEATEPPRCRRWPQGCPGGSDGKEDGPALPGSLPSLGPGCRLSRLAVSLGSQGLQVNPGH